MVAAAKQRGRDEAIRHFDANHLLLHGISWERYLMLLEALEVRVLSKGKYRLRKASAVLPGLKPADLIPFLQLAPQAGETEMLRRFQEWVRGRVAAGQLKPNE